MILPTASETRTAIEGAASFFRLDASAIAAFGAGREAVFKSFSVIIFILPVSLLIEYTIGTGTAPMPARLARTAVNLLLHWTLFMAIVYGVLTQVGESAKAMLVLTVNNWCSALGSVLYLAPVAAVLFGIMTPPSALVFAFFTSLYLMFFHWFAAKTALGGRSGLAAGIVAIDFSLAILIGRLLGLDGG
ncbi:MAG: hypothetical protein ACR2OJ_12160 [Hyphomicrobiales bacterium]